MTESNRTNFDCEILRHQVEIQRRILRPQLNEFDSRREYALELFELADKILADTTLPKSPFYISKLNLYKRKVFKHLILSREDKVFIPKFPNPFSVEFASYYFEDPEIKVVCKGN